MTTDDDRLEAWLSGDLAPDDLPAFQAWLRADAASRRRYLAAVAMDQDLRAALRLSAPLSLPPRWRHPTMALPLAAAAALLLVIGLFAVAWWPEARPRAATRVVEGWQLTEQLRTEPRDAPAGRSTMVVATDEGWLEGDLGRVTMSKGAVLRLDRPGSEDPAELGLEQGTITVNVPERDEPAPFATTAVIGTACGDVLLAPGTTCSLTATHPVAPDGSATAEVLIDIQRGSVHSAAPNPVPTAWSAGTRVRLWRDADGHLHHEILTSP